MAVAVAFAPHATRTMANTTITADRGSTNFFVFIGFSLLLIFGYPPNKLEGRGDLRRRNRRHISGPPLLIEKIQI
jgi:hypothetical protein